MLKTFASIIIGLMLLLLMGCTNKPTHLSEWDVSMLYFPISPDDEFRLTYGWHEQLVRTSFSETELHLIYDALYSFELYDGEIAPPWKDNVAMQPFGQPTILTITNDEHIIMISFVPHSVLGYFAYAEIDNGTRQWFTMDGYYFNQLIRLVVD